MDADFGDFTVDYEVPAEINYDIDLLKKFIEKDPELLFSRRKTLTVKALKSKVRGKQK